MSSQSSRSRPIVSRLASLALVALTILTAAGGYLAGSRHALAPQHAAAAPAANCRTFPETGATVCDRFLEYWDTHGGLAQQGLPLADAAPQVSAVDGKTYTMQYFERAVFELHPENAPPYDVLLSLLGREKFLANQHPSTGPQPSMNPSPSPSPAPSTAPSGWPRSADGIGFRLTVSGVTDPVHSDSQYYQPKPATRWYAIDTTLANTGSAELSVNIFYFRLRGADGRDYSASAKQIPSPQLGLLKLQPGQDTRGWVTFEIPSDLAVINVTYDPNFGKGPATVDLR